MIHVRVVFAQPEKQSEVELEVAPGTTLRQVAERSGMVLPIPLRLGVFGHVRKPDEQVADGDRIEIYRELLNDPKDARRQRAKQNR